MRREYMFAQQPEKTGSKEGAPTLRLSKEINSSQIPSYMPPAARNVNLEDRIAENERHIHTLLSQKQQDDYFQHHVYQKNKLEKEISIRQIVEDEKRILEARHKKDLEELKQ